jgi:RNA polymerase sigma-70 factor (ECF subfamily)
MVRVRLADNRLRRLLDSVDVCQSVLASFFVRATLGRFTLGSPDDLLKLLATLVRHKLADRLRKELAARRDQRRRGGAVEVVELVDPAPTPCRGLANRELLDEVRRRLSPDDRMLLGLREEGLGWGELAARVGGSAEALRKRLTRALDLIAEQLELEG